MSDETKYVREVCEAATPGPYRVDTGAPDPIVRNSEGAPVAICTAFHHNCAARAIALHGSTWREALAVIECAVSPRQAGLHQVVDAYLAAVRAHRDREGVNPGFHEPA